MRRLILGCLGALISIAGPLSGQAKSAPGSFVPGEVILRFKPYSESAKLVASIPAGGSQPGSALSTHIGALSNELGTPFRVKQLISGGNLLLEIERAELSARIRERLLANPVVKQAHPTPVDPSRPPAVRIGFQIDFVEKSSEAAAVKKAGRELQAIAESLGKQTGASFIAEVSPSRQLLLIVDLEGLTLDLVTRLGKLADVEYAQPNFVHRPMRRLNPGAAGLQ